MLTIFLIMGPDNDQLQKCQIPLINPNQPLYLVLSIKTVPVEPPYILGLVTLLLSLCGDPVEKP